MTDLPKYVYVASSWRNSMQEVVIETLKAAKIPAYDFKNPEPNTGFKWTEVMPTFDIEEQLADTKEYLQALDHPRSEDGFKSDWDAMNKADTFILVLPCGRSAHLELGWAVGAGKRTAIFLDPNKENKVTPELMYKMVDFITPSFMDLLDWLGVED